MTRLALFLAGVALALVSPFLATGAADVCADSLAAWCGWLGWGGGLAGGLGLAFGVVVGVAAFGAGIACAVILILAAGVKRVGVPQSWSA